MPEHRVGRYVGDDDEAVAMLRSALASRKENPEWAGTGSREKGPRVLSHEEGLKMKAEALEMKAQVLERKVMLERKGKFWKTDIKGASERWSNTNLKPGEEKE